MDEVTVDVEEAGAVGLPVDEMAVPDLVEDRPCIGHEALRLLLARRVLRHRLIAVRRGCAALCRRRLGRFDRQLGGRCRRSRGRHRVEAALVEMLPLALVDAGRLAGQAAQEIELGTAHGAAAHHLDLGDARRIEREDALDTLAVGDLAQREVGIDARILARNAYAFEGLDAFALALDHLDANLERVAGPEFRYGAAGEKLLHAFLVEHLHHVHDSLLVPVSPAGETGTRRESWT